MTRKERAIRRLALILLLFAFAGFAVAPALDGASAAPSRTHVAAKKPSKPQCKSPKKGKKAKKTKCTPPKKAKKKKKKKKKPAATARPTATDTPTATPTATATATATSTPTATATSTPAPSISAMPLRGDVQYGYQAAFFICGLPPGVSAGFSPNPAASIVDPASPAGAAAHSTLWVTTPPGTPPGVYSLAIHAYYHDPSGKSVQAPPGGGAVDPPGATLSVDGSGNTTLTSLSPEPAVGLQNCSPIPVGFGPSPTPTPAPASINVVGWVSDPYPTSGELETVYGSIQAAGQPVSNVLIHTHWYFPDGIRSCDAVTGTNGIGSCSLILPHMLPYQTVQIQLTFLFNNQQYVTYTSFTT